MAFNPIEAQKYLKGMQYPASKQDVIDHAKSNDAPQEMIDDLESDTQDQFENPGEVQKAFSKS
ncbi:MAG: hypothetical protein AVDCRST_MAG45-271 [uncultured Solirubrobacterales bacterium]|uniref:DUF2795 domain-containing protein n=1 Tax=uncultured Solirubrobacterales bacterium TaxID=768556 RepID=A0A6J4RV61_9ACTN|nr:MAG: hypothetical protein AVDCRST_MAG45-271 [uncultured Solirubrobacterales bacterium]